MERWQSELLTLAGLPHDGNGIFGRGLEYELEVPDPPPGLPKSPPMPGRVWGFAFGISHAYDELYRETEPRTALYLFLMEAMNASMPVPCLRLDEGGRWWYVTYGCYEGEWGWRDFRVTAIGFL